MSRILKGIIGAVLGSFLAAYFAGNPLIGAVTGFIIGLLLRGRKLPKPGIRGTGLHPEGCSLCKHAGHSTEASNIAPALSRRQMKKLQEAEEKGQANYYCVHFDQPVRNERGINCPAYRFDKS